jgi:DNA end-binding protein Ku
VVDLMAALKKSLNTGDAKPAAKAKAPTKKAATKKPAAKKRA